MYGMGVVEAMVHSESLGPIKSTNSTWSEERSGRSATENCDMVFFKYKRRKVSAVRDFPSSCGRVSSQINLRPVMNVHVPAPVSSESYIRSSEDAACVFNTLPGLDEVPRNSDVIMATDSPGCISLFPQSSLRPAEKGIRDNSLGSPPEVHVSSKLVESVADEQGVFTNQEDSQNSKEVKPLNAQSEENMEGLKDSGLADHGKSMEHGTSLSKDFHETNDPVPSKEISHNFKNCSVDCFVSVSNDGGLENAVSRNFPRQRRVSAVRDFPSLCGRDASLLSKGENVIASVNEKSLEQEKSGFNDKPSDKAASKYDKMKGEDNEQGKTSNECRPSGQKKESFMSLEILSERIVVQALMASSTCPWRQGKYLKRPESGTTKLGQVKKHVPKQVGEVFSMIEDEDKDSEKINFGKKSKMSSKASGGGTLQLVCREEDNIKPDYSPSKKSIMTANGSHGGTNQHLIPGEEMLKLKNDEFHVGQSSRACNVSVTPFVQRNVNGNSLDNDAIVPRTKVRETLRLFHAICRKLLQEEEAGSKKAGNSHKRVDFQAAKILKDKGKYVNEGKQILGFVPGVEVGDEFRYRVELNIIGLHRQIQGGIDYVKHDGTILATSIVASGGYSDDLDSSDTLVYTGQGGNVMSSGKEPEDQKLERGNLALKNSLDERNPVRVIRGFDVSEGRTYVYDGFYLVDKWWQDMGPHGRLVFKFLLNRIPNQPELAWKEIKKSKKLKVREGLCVNDISEGKECCPISAVNTIDNEKPPPFTYITRIMYPDWCRPIPPMGCDCVNGCSNSCSCAVKNGGELPYNYNEAIVEAKPIVYECGPSCKCPSSCSNRVSQKGIKFQLEIFKTKSRGWGVRSLNSIPSGSFICEYVGELIDEKEAEQRSNDEYLFDIGSNYNDSSLWDGLSTLIPEIQASSSKEVEEGNFTIDAAEFGNVGRFINHCCSPNLYAQNVLYDHDDNWIPHIMLFAAENIPPLQELTYHYNYVIDQVRDSNGNIKKKSCYCGSVECTGRMY